MNQDLGFDPVTGRLRLTRQLLADMTALHTGQERPPRTGLDSTGLVEGGALHPRLVPVADTVTNPYARLSLDLDARRRLHCEGWIGDRFALVLVGETPTAPAFEATFLSRSLLTGQLGRLVALGPRPRTKVSDPVETDEGLLETLLAGGAPVSPSQVEMLIGAHDDIVPAWLDVLSTLSRPSLRWRAGAWWNAPEESPQARLLEIIDSDAGMFLVSHVPRREHRYARVSLRPVTPSQVWRLLCGLLPRPEEIAAPL